MKDPGDIKNINGPRLPSEEDRESLIDPEKFRRITKVDEADESQQRRKRSKAEQMQEEEDESEETIEEPKVTREFSSFMDESKTSSPFDVQSPTKATSRPLSTPPKDTELFQSPRTSYTPPIEGSSQEASEALFENLPTPPPEDVSLPSEPIKTKAPSNKDNNDSSAPPSLGPKPTEATPSGEKTHLDKQVKNKKVPKAAIKESPPLTRNDKKQTQETKHPEIPIATQAKEPKKEDLKTDQADEKITQKTPAQPLKEEAPLHAPDLCENKEPLHTLPKIETDHKETKTPQQPQIDQIQPETIPLSPLIEPNPPLVKEKPKSEIIQPSTPILYDEHGKLKTSISEKHDKEKDSNGQQDNPLPFNQVGQVQTVQPIETSSTYTKLSPEVFDLFERMVGVIQIESMKGKSVTEVTLSLPSSPFNGSKIVLEHFDTAPHSFNLQLQGSEEAVNMFNANMSALVAAFEGSKLAFQIHIRRPELLKKYQPDFSRRALDEEDQSENR